jgi:hypothetical protein
MGSRVSELFERWSNEHVNAIPYPEHLNEAQRLDKQFRAHAQATGVAEQELQKLEEDLGQDLVSEFRDRLDARTNEEVMASANRDP